MRNVHWFTRCNDICILSSRTWLSLQDIIKSDVYSLNRWEREKVITDSSLDFDIARTTKVSLSKITDRFTEFYKKYLFRWLAAKQLEKFQIYFCCMKRFLSRKTFYIYNSIGFASEGKIIIYIAMNLALVLRRCLIFSCFLTLQVEGRTAIASKVVSCVLNLTMPF